MRVQTDLAQEWARNRSAARLVPVPDDPEMRVSHEAIYQALYVQGRGRLKRRLITCLRGPGVRCASRGARSKVAGPGSWFELMISGNAAPEAADRAVPGHWEGDLIIGTGNKSAIGTLVERTTRFTMLLHLPVDHGAVAVRDAIAAAILTLPAALRRSLTWDQGTELAGHAQLKIDTDLDIYFCDPHSPWQRGTNENTNGLLRQYFPKAPTCPCTRPPNSSASQPPDSTGDHGKPSTGAPQPGPGRQLLSQTGLTTVDCDDQLNPPRLRRAHRRRERLPAQGCRSRRPRRGGARHLGR